MGKRISDNFKKRFGDPERVEIKFETKKASFVEESSRNQKMAEAATGVLRGILGREPTHDEIIGKVDISDRKSKGKL